MGAAEHGAQFPMAQKLRQSMTMSQLHDFAVGSEKGKPEHVRKRKPAHGGKHPQRNLGKYAHPKGGY